VIFLGGLYEPPRGTNNTSTWLEATIDFAEHAAREKKALVMITADHQINILFLAQAKNMFI